VRWQGATTPRARSATFVLTHSGIRLGSGAAAHARKDEQRCQRAAAQLDRVRSAVTQEATVVVGSMASVHARLPAEKSGQLPFSG
jgi:hypothetical protein